MYSIWFKRAFSSIPFRHSELSPSSPNILLRLSLEEKLFAERLGFKVDETSYQCSPSENSVVSPHFIIQALTHKSYRDGIVPCNDKLILLGSFLILILNLRSFIL